jgi:hypothetical protein
MKIGWLVVTQRDGLACGGCGSVDVVRPSDLAPYGPAAYGYAFCKGCNSWLKP